MPLPVAPREPRDAIQGTFDAVVVGAGPAGLTGAIYLARFRRKVLVLDAGGGRATRIPRSHNVPGYVDGVNGQALVAAMRQQAAGYSVQFAHGTVQRLTAADGGFDVTWPGADGRARRVRARCVLLATGVADIEPDMAHLPQAVARGALRYCPVCDGFEVIDQQVGVLGDGPRGAHEALYLRQFTPRLCLYDATPQGRLAATLDAALRRSLAEAGIAVEPAPVESIGLRDGGGVVLRHGGRSSACDALYAALGLQVHAGLGTQLGAGCDADGYLVTDRHQQTTVDGLYAAGDVARGLNQIVVAMGDAAIAASAMHLRLRDA